MFGELCWCGWSLYFVLCVRRVLWYGFVGYRGPAALGFGVLNFGVACFEGGVLLVVLLCLELVGFGFWAVDG